VTLCRKLGGGVVSNDALTFFLEKCLNDEVTMAFHLLLPCLNLNCCPYEFKNFGLFFPVTKCNKVLINGNA